MSFKPRLISTLVLVLLVTTLGRIPPVRGGEPPPGWHQNVPSGPVSIDGVEVSGLIGDVSLADVLQAIAAFKDIGLQNLAAATVINKDEIHGYVRNRDLGWFTAKRTTFVWPDRSEHQGWDAYGQGLPYYSAALLCIRAAQQVYIFPVTTPADPHRDDKRLRLLAALARSQLVDVLGPKQNWLVGLNDLMYPDKEPKSVGFVFRNRKDELVLFFVHSDVVVGTFNGEHLSGTLDDLSPRNRKLAQAWDRWKDQFAQPELGTHGEAGIKSHFLPP